MFKEFKEFAFEGNFLDMAIGIVVGGAFATIVSGLVEGIINPIIGALTSGVNLKELAFNFLGVNLQYGLLVDAFIKFLLIAFFMFLIVRSANRMRRKEEITEPTTKICPYCKSEVDLDATRCAHCTSQLTEKIV